MGGGDERDRGREGGRERGERGGDKRRCNVVGGRGRGGLGQEG